MSSEETKDLIITILKLEGKPLSFKEIYDRMDVKEAIAVQAMVELVFNGTVQREEPFVPTLRYKL